MGLEDVLIIFARRGWQFGRAFTRSGSLLAVFLRDFPKNVLNSCVSNVFLKRICEILAKP